MASEAEKSRLKKLVELVLIGQLVINEVIEEEAATQDYFNTLQGIYEMCYEAGLTDLIEKDEESGLYIETEAFEKYIFKEIMDEYEDKVFLSVLPYQLAMRDAVSEYSKKTHYNITDFYDKVRLLEKSYVMELATNGIERLHLVNQGFDEDVDSDEGMSIIMT